MADRSEVTIQVSGEPSRVTWLAMAGAWLSFAHRSPGPSNSTYSTNGPTVSSASSLTTDSKAMASIMPRCCSEACTLRTPNRMVNSAINAATIREVSVCTMPARLSVQDAGSAMVRKVDDTACSWSAM